MTRRMKLLVALGVGLAAVAGGTAYAYAMQDAAAQLRASGEVGEQADGYLGLVGSASADVRAQMDSVNIQRRAAYTELASQRGATIEAVAAAPPSAARRSRRSPRRPPASSSPTASARASITGCPTASGAAATAASRCRGRRTAARFRRSSRSRGAGGAEQPMKGALLHCGRAVDLPVPPS